MCVTLATNVLVVSRKDAKICLDFGYNVVHCIDLRVVLDLAAPIKNCTGHGLVCAVQSID